MSWCVIGPVASAFIAMSLLPIFTRAYLLVVTDGAIRYKTILRSVSIDTSNLVGIRIARWSGMLQPFNRCGYIISYRTNRRARRITLIAKDTPEFREELSASIGGSRTIL